MKVVEKIKSNNFKGFDWLDFDYLPNSQGFKFEIDFKESEDLVSQSIAYFYSLFQSFLSNVLIKPFGEESEWGNFCLDIWDMENDRYDYSSENKEEPTASYLAMLGDCKIEPDYTGFCECLDWDKFLYVTVHCVMQHTAPYSMMFYDPKNEFVVYFHHSGSFGVYYKEFGEVVKSIIRNAQGMRMVIKNANDAKVGSLIE